MNIPFWSLPPFAGIFVSRRATALPFPPTSDLRHWNSTVKTKKIRGKILELRNSVSNPFSLCPFIAVTHDVWYCRTPGDGLLSGQCVTAQGTCK